MTKVWRRVCLPAFCSAIVVVASGADQVVDLPATGPAPIHIPLTVSQTHAGTYKAIINVGIGNLKPMPFVFDTGSTGLHVFAALDLSAADSGVKVSDTPISFTVGNPGRITYKGFICYAKLHLGNYTTPEAVPIAYLTSASATSANPDAKIPDLHDPEAHGGYGVFGSGITGLMPVPNPILTLPSPYSLTYSIRLTHDRGELILGDSEPVGAVRFPLIAGRCAGETWEHGQASLFINGDPIGSPLAISFDTGNGVPWIHSNDLAGIPQKDSLVIPSTRLGFGPAGATREAIAVVAGTEFAHRIKLTATQGAPLTNVGVEAFFDHIVTYDNVKGTISVTPISPPEANRP